MIHYTQLGNFLTEYSDRNEGNKYRPVAVGRYGIRTRESIYSKELAKDYSKNKLIYKDTLTVGMGSVQIDIGILTEEAIYSVSPAYHTYRIVGINANYLRYCLECRNQDMFVRFAKRGSRQGKTIDLKRWLTYEIPVHDVATQKEIVKMLNHVCALIEQRLQQMEEIDQLVKSRFIEMFGDMADPKCSHPKYKLYEACKDFDDIKCGPFGTQLNKDEYQKSGVAVWEIPQVNSAFTERPTHYVTKEKATELKAYSLIPGDIAMSRKGNVGKCGLFPEGYPKGIIHSDVLRIRVDQERVNPCFLMHQLHYSGDVQRQIEMVSSGAIMAGINVTKLKQIEVYIPDYELQNCFAEFVQATDKSKYYSSLSLECCRLAANKYRQEWMICQILNF